MIDTSKIRGHMEVIGSDGQHVGTVDRVEGNRIKLAKSDPAAQGRHQYLPLDSVGSVEGNAIRLRQTAQEVKKAYLEGDGRISVITTGSKGDSKGADEGGPERSIA